MEAQTPAVHEAQQESSSDGHKIQGEVGTAVEWIPAEEAKMIRDVDRFAEDMVVPERQTGIQETVIPPPPAGQDGIRHNEMRRERGVARQRLPIPGTLEEPFQEGGVMVRIAR